MLSTATPVSAPMRRSRLISRGASEIARRLFEATVVWRHFDTGFYRTANPDVAESRVPAVLHYLFFGAREGRDPAPGFSTRGYLDCHPDVAGSPHNPFYHFVRFGKSEGRHTQAEAADPPRRPDATHVRLTVGTDARVVPLRRLSRDPLDLTATGTPADDAPSPVDQAFVARALALTGGRTLSLDIWDTILRRRCHPDETKLRAARALWLTGVRDNPGLRALHPVDLFEIRRVAEELCADAGWEYRFADAARMWLHLLELPDAAHLDTVRAREVGIERRAAYPDATIAALIAGHQGPTMAVSDFYLGGETLRDLLRQNGIRLSGRVYASCDVMRTKREGALFDHVLRREGLAPGAVLHLGDRQGADVDRPRERGIDALIYDDPAETARAARRDARLRAHLAGDAGPHSREILARTCGAWDGQGALPVEAMAVLGVGASLHVLEEAVRRDVPEVFFFTREGVFLKRLYARLVAADALDLGSYPAHRLLEVSRRSTFAASLREFSVRELMRVWSQYSTQSLDALAVTLNLPPESLRVAARRHGIAMSEPIGHPWEDPRVRAFCRDAEVRRVTRPALAAQRNDLLAYLENAGFRPAEDVDRLIVDIGWRGTIQDNLARICRGRSHGCYLGLDRYLNPQAETVSKSAFLTDLNRAEPQFRISEVAALELLFGASGGSVSGYRDGAALRDIHPGEEAVLAGPVAAMTERMAAAAEPCIAYVRDHGLVSSDLRPLALAVAEHAMRRPPPELAEAFVALDHNETFGTGRTDTMAGPARRFATLGRQTGAALHRDLGAALDGLRWPEAHRVAGPVRRFLDGLPVARQLQIPFGPASPAVVARVALGRPKVSFFAPPPICGSGGHRTIYEFGRRLALAGYDVHLLNESGGAERDACWQANVIAGAGITRHDTWHAVPGTAVAVATIAHSAFAACRIHGAGVGKLYFVQDLEAQFNPVGDVYLQGQRSYAEGCHHITVGSWLSHVLRTQYGVGAASGGLGVDPSVYGASLARTGSAPPARNRRIAFLHQPEKFRRAPDLCIRALSILARRVPDVDIVSYGSERAPDLPFPTTHLGLVHDLAALDALYASSRLGLCVSATNPSRIPFEMMAAGCVPVDIYAYNNLFDYGAGTALLAYQSPDSLADAMYRLLTDDALHAARRAGCLKFMSGRTLDWEMDVAANSVGHVLLGGTLDDLPPPAPIYSDPPVVAPAEETRPTRAFLDWQWRQAGL